MGKFAAVAAIACAAIGITAGAYKAVKKQEYGKVGRPNNE